VSDKIGWDGYIDERVLKGLAGKAEELE